MVVRSLFFLVFFLVLFWYCTMCTHNRQYGRRGTIEEVYIIFFLNYYTYTTTTTLYYNTVHTATEKHTPTPLFTSNLTVF